MRGKLLLILVVALASVVPGKTLAQAPLADQSLNVDDPKDKVRTSSVCKTFTYKMIEGRTYQIDMKSKEIDSYLRLENPEGVQVAFDDDSGGFPDARIVYRALKTGDYTIICTTYAAASTGRFTLTVKDSDSARGAPARPKEFSGELTANDPKDRIRVASVAKTFTFEMEKGRTYQIDLKSKDFDAYLRLENPAGTQVAFDDDSGGYPDARILYTALESGDFKIIATTFNGGGTGKFMLTIRPTDQAQVGPALSVKAACNPPTGTIGVNYTVTAVVQSREAGLVHVEITLPPADRIVSAPSDQSITAGGTTTFTWIVYCGGSGRVNVQANMVRGLQQFSGELTANDPKDKVRNASFFKSYTYQMEKGRTYQIDLKSKDFDSYLRLENPAGIQVALDDDGGGFPDARIIYKAQESGDFKIIATTFIGGTGKFTLTVKEASPAPVPAPAPEVNQSISANGTWTGTENLAGFGNLTFVFQEGGKATMTDAKSTGNGSWTQTGRDVTIRFSNCVYTGQITGVVLQGTAQWNDGTRTWSFRVEKK